MEDWKVENLFGGLSPACDFMDLVQSGNYSVVTLPAHPGEYSVTAFPAQNEFYTRPVTHEGHDLARARPPLQGSFGHLFAASTTVSQLHINPPNRPYS